MKYTKRHSKRVRFSKRHSKSKSLTSKVYKLAKRVYAHPQNYKYITYNSTLFNTLVNASPFTQCMNICPQGTDEANTRIGDRVKNQWLDMRFELYAQGSTPFAPQFVRILLIYEGRSALGSAASPLGVLGSNAPTPLSQRNYTSRDNKRYRILYDKIHYVGPNIQSVATTSVQTIGSNCTNERIVHIKRRLTKFPTDYSRGNSGTVSDIDTGVITFMAVTDNSIANIIGCAATMTLCFLDA